MPLARHAHRFVDRPSINTSALGWRIVRQPKLSLEHTLYQSIHCLSSHAFPRAVESFVRASDKAPNRARAGSDRVFAIRQLWHLLGTFFTYVRFVRPSDKTIVEIVGSRGGVDRQSINGLDVSLIQTGLALLRTPDVLCAFWFASIGRSSVPSWRGDPS